MRAGTTDRATGRAPTGTGAPAGEAPLRVLREARLADLLARVRCDPAGATAGPDAGRRLEGSGVAFAGGRLLVVFDNLALVASVDPALPVPDPSAVLHPLPPDLTGLEDIAVDEMSGHAYVVVEGRDEDVGPRALVAQLDPQWRLVGRKRVDVPLATPNKGIEGLALVHRGGRRYLLGLLEGNRGLAGKRGREGGGGRVQVLVEQDHLWHSVATLKLPKSLRFADYSGLSVSKDRIAVVSQQSAALWVGSLSPARWEVLDEGTVHPFPRDERGRAVYRTVEGVAWLGEGELAVVSDRDEARERRRGKEQALHVVALPGPPC